MARGGTPSRLLMLSLEAALLLLVAGISAAAAFGDTDIIIHLPTHVRGGGGVADLATAMASAIAHDVGDQRPWECCDRALCTRSFPPVCRCYDVVDQCSSACKLCEETEDSRHTCADWYPIDVAEPIPECHRGARHVVHAAAAARATTTKGGDGDDDEKRPWKCCNMAICTKSWPPTCFCMDKVKQCASTCEHCEQVEGSGEDYRCLDSYRGEPGPRCEDEEEEKWVASAHRFFLARKK